MKNTFFLILILVSCNGFSQKNANVKFYKKIISVLAHDSLNGRSTSSIYETKAANFIIHEFKKIKLNSKLHNFAYKKDSLEVKSSKNVYCYIDNKSEKTILLSAHYDHIGHGEGLSRSFGKKGIHNGADDNASGVALLLSLSKKLKTNDFKFYNYLVVTYSAHEIGLFGSMAFEKFIENRLKKIDLVINFDMVGRLDTESKILTITGKNTLKDAFKTKIENCDFFGKISYENDENLLLTDAKWFYKKSIPCISITTGIHGDYHKISDDVETINFNGIFEIEKYIVQLLKFKL